MTCQEGICNTTLGHRDTRFMTLDTTLVYGSTIGSNALDANLTGYSIPGFIPPRIFISSGN
ncbi:DEHA2E07326p [Debaryomyces hansenii CBS767]|uniref:DEHA2E07326p n=1 Tax=Debaryomyces hansenii (strain ATCC 36239 / CBS 767 / BCRC 21394 / JCM 1990 / NBRC 0083 / IGC 2968) TaxID=284592 RepID=Q6BQ91_DEBHA|nr:DEHA2E07326p [Debaryomyces hansenii CBS767]CAG87859.1 DEHA2E07326p [Debaryomyces hansenii CBS767]|eukprot:XP_459629.1 DEHA2E07326p [Debaryomyces hansenii CBS767]